MLVIYANEPLNFIKGYIMAKPKALKTVASTLKEETAPTPVHTTTGPASKASVEQPRTKFQQSGRVKHISGSVLFPHDAGLRIILNIANMAGKMESPLYPLFEKKWPAVKREVRGSFVNKTGKYVIGSIASNLSLQSDVWCVSVLVQDVNLKTDLKALETSLKEVAKLCVYERASLHVSNLLTQAIPELEELVAKNVIEKGVSVLYYTEPTVA